MGLRRGLGGPASPESQGVESSNIPKEQEKVLGVGLLNTEVANKQVNFEEFLGRLRQSWKPLEKGVNLRL